MLNSSLSGSCSRQSCPRLRADMSPPWPRDSPQTTLHSRASPCRWRTAVRTATTPRTRKTANRTAAADWNRSTHTTISYFVWSTEHCPIWTHPMRAVWCDWFWSRASCEWPGKPCWIWWTPPLCTDTIFLSRSRLSSFSLVLPTRLAGVLESGSRWWPPRPTIHWLPHLFARPSPHCSAPDLAEWHCWPYCLKSFYW